MKCVFICLFLIFCSFNAFCDLKSYTFSSSYTDNVFSYGMTTQQKEDFAKQETYKHVAKFFKKNGYRKSGYKLVNITYEFNWNISGLVCNMILSYDDGKLLGISVEAQNINEYISKEKVTYKELNKALSIYRDTFKASLAIYKKYLANNNSTFFNIFYEPAYNETISILELTIALFNANSELEGYDSIRDIFKSYEKVKADFNKIKSDYDKIADKYYKALEIVTQQIKTAKNKVIEIAENTSNFDNVGYAFIEIDKFYKIDNNIEMAYSSALDLYQSSLHELNKAVEDTYKVIKKAKKPK